MSKKDKINNSSDLSSDDSNLYKTANLSIWELLKPRSREMRKESTVAEDKFWQAVRNKKLGVSFRRQHAINHYIADFVCLDKKLIIEIDWSIHDIKIESDEERTAYLNSIGYHIIRFKNEEVINDIESVKLTVIEVLGKINIK